MRIEEDTKLDFADVLIRPKRSTLSSRSGVDLIRHFAFKHSGNVFQGCPIIGANMDGVGTISMAQAFYADRNGLTVALRKHYSVDQLIEFFRLPESANSWYTIGTSQADIDKLVDVLQDTGAAANIDKICLDVANGYTEAFVQHVSVVRALFPNITIMAGNVVTADMTEALILAGADVVKVGIGPGCFVAGSQVQTSKGIKPIEKVQVGDEVLTHTLSWRKVKHTFKFDHHKKIMSVNGVKATPNHEFYVLHKRFKNVVTDSNIHEYAEWMAAEHLNKDYFLIKHPV